MKNKKRPVLALLTFFQIVFGILPLCGTIMLLFLSIQHKISWSPTMCMKIFGVSIFLIIALSTIKNSIRNVASRENHTELPPMNNGFGGHVAPRINNNISTKPIVQTLHNERTEEQTTIEFHKKIESYHEEHEHNKWGAYDYQLGEHQTRAKIGLLCPRCGESFYAEVSQKTTRCPKCHKKVNVC